MIDFTFSAVNALSIYVAESGSVMIAEESPLDDTPQIIEIPLDRLPKVIALLQQALEQLTAPTE